MVRQSLLKKNLLLAPHRLIDILDPAESYSAMNFVTMRSEMTDITAQGKIPFGWRHDVVLQALIEGLSPLPSADENLRLEIEEKRKIWLASTSSKLQKLIPISAGVLIQMIHNALIAH